MKRLAFAALLVPIVAWSQTETRELVGQIGSRPALLVLHASRTAEGAWQMAGEYIVLPTLQRRFLEGESSPEIGVTTLREGTTAILFGRPSTGELRGTLRAGVFKGARFAPGGQERERFEFSEEFPSMEAYSTNLRCEAADAHYVSSLQLAVKPASCSRSTGARSSRRAATPATSPTCSSSPGRAACASARAAATSRCARSANTCASLRRTASSNAARRPTSSPC